MKLYENGQKIIGQRPKTSAGVKSWSLKRDLLVATTFTILSHSQDTFKPLVTSMVLLNKDKRRTVAPI